MTHTVFCGTCGDKWGQPKRWRENCEDCAQDIADKHRRETGHPVDIHITTPTIANLQRDIRTANLIARRNGW